MENTTPENVEDLKRKAADKTSYNTRLEAVEELGNYKCRQSIDILWRLMISDKVHGVQHRAFLKLQAFGEDVKLPRKPKGHLIKDVNKQLGKVLTAIGGTYSRDEFNKKFAQLYPETFDVYSFEKKGSFDGWITNVLQSLPKKKLILDATPPDLSST